MIRCTPVYCTPRCVCNFGRERNDVEGCGFHDRQLIEHPRFCIGEIQAANSIAAFLWKARRRPKGDGYNSRRWLLTATKTPERSALLPQQLQHDHQLKPSSRSSK